MGQGAKKSVCFSEPEISPKKAPTHLRARPIAPWRRAHGSREQEAKSREELAAHAGLWS
jgi:hypothetical protein